MKKIISILISLLLLASAFGIGTTMAGVPGHVEPETVRVGEIITVTNYVPPYGNDPLIKIYHPDLEPWGYWPDEEALKGYPDAYAYVTKLSGPTEILEGCVKTWVWTYRANRPGKIVFLVWESGRSWGSVENVVTITPGAQLPMHHFMKILGFGGLMRE